MNILLKVSLLMFLSVSSMAYASQSFVSDSDSDVDMKEDTRKRTRAEAQIVTEEPTAKRQKVSTEGLVPETNTSIRSMRRPRITDVSVAEEDTSLTRTEPLTNNPMELLLTHSDLFPRICSLQHDDDSLINGLRPIVKDADMLEVIKKLCCVSTFLNQSFNSKNTLGRLFPFLSDRILKAENPLQKLGPNIPKLILLDFETEWAGNLWMSRKAEMVFLCDSDRYHKFNVNTRQMNVLEGCAMLLGISGDGKTALGQTFLTENDLVGALWKDTEETPSPIPKLDPVGMTHDGVILGYLTQPERLHNGSNAALYEDDDRMTLSYFLQSKGRLNRSNSVLYKNGEIIEKIPFYFTVSKVLPDGEIILGLSGYQAAIWHKSEIKKMPEGFCWSTLRSKGQEIVGDYNGHLAKYIDGKVEVYEMGSNKVKVRANAVKVVNDGLIICEYDSPDCRRPSSHIWKDGFCYSVFQLLKKIGCEFNEKNIIQIMDVSLDNQTFGGVIYHTINKTMGFIAQLPLHLFKEENRVTYEVN